MDKNRIVQIAILVKDCKRTAENWAKLLGVETPAIFSTEGADKTNAVYKGKPCNGRIYQAIFELDNVQLELIQPYGDEPSVWKDCLDEMGECIHHLAFRTEDIKSDMDQFARQGVPFLQYGEWGGGSGKYSYHDTRQTLGAILELLDF